MEEMQLKETLMEAARRAGICAEGYELMRSYDRNKLVDFYVQNPDWCLERDFPDIQTLSEKFSDCEDKGVFVGKTFHGELLNEHQAYIFHNCKGSIKVGLNIKKAIIPMLYLANGCRLRIVGVGQKVAPRNRPIVPVYSFGANDISARDNLFVVFNRLSCKLL